MVKIERGKLMNEDFIEASKPLVEWFKENCNQHHVIIISDGMVRVASDDMGFGFSTEVKHD